MKPRLRRTSFFFFEGKFNVFIAILLKGDKITCPQFVETLGSTKEQRFSSFFFKGRMESLNVEIRASVLVQSNDLWLC